MSKGQVLSIDLLIATAIFLFILNTSVLIWNSELSRKNDMEARKWMEESARTTSNQLVTSQGDPSDWQNLQELNESSLHSLGLVDSRNMLNQKKVDKLSLLSNTNYALIKRVIGLEAYNVTIYLISNKSSMIFGTEPASEEGVISVDRFALLNDSKVTIRMKVWR